MDHTLRVNALMGKSPFPAIVTYANEFSNTKELLSCYELKHIHILLSFKLLLGTLMILNNMIIGYVIEETDSRFLLVQGSTVMVT